VGKVAERITENLQRLAANQDIEGLVDPDLGY